MTFGPLEVVNANIKSYITKIYYSIRFILHDNIWLRLMYYISFCIEILIDKRYDKKNNPSKFTIEKFEEFESLEIVQITKK